MDNVWALSSGVGRSWVSTMQSDISISLSISLSFISFRHENHLPSSVVDVGADWTCNHCTYINNGGAQVCEMCQLPRWKTNFRSMEANWLVDNIEHWLKLLEVEKTKINKFERREKKFFSLFYFLFVVIDEGKLDSRANDINLSIKQFSNFLCFN